MKNRNGEGEALYLEYLDAEEAGDTDRAQRALKKSVRLGSKAARHALAYQMDTSGSADISRMLRLYRAAARDGLAASATNLARHYEIRGRIASYLKWTRRAAELGDPEASEELDFPAPYLLEHGLRLRELGQIAEGEAIIRKIAKLGNPDALAELQRLT